LTVAHAAFGSSSLALLPLPSVLRKLQQCNELCAAGMVMMSVGDKREIGQLAARVAGIDFFVFDF
jgi:hypothetical protein